MTDLLVRDPNDSGEWRLASEVIETVVIDDDPTRNLVAHVAANHRRPAAHPELEHNTGELPLWPTGAELAVLAAADGPVVPDQPRPPHPILDPPTPDPVPRPSWAQDAAEWAIIRREVRTHRRRRSRVDWSWVMLSVLLPMVVSASVTSVLLWAVTR